MYLYKTRIYKTPEPSYAPAGNAGDRTDFEDASKKGEALSVTKIDVSETTFELDLTYTSFKAFVVSPILWSDVKYVESPAYYDLLLASENEL
jgi:hypothetical protein